MAKSIPGASYDYRITLLDEPRALWRLTPSARPRDAIRLNLASWADLVREHYLAVSGEDGRAGGEKWAPQRKAGAPKMLAKLADSRLRAIGRIVANDVDHASDLEDRDNADGAKYEEQRADRLSLLTGLHSLGDCAVLAKAER